MIKKLDIHNLFCLVQNKLLPHLGPADQLALLITYTSNRTRSKTLKSRSSQTKHRYSAWPNWQIRCGQAQLWFVIIILSNYANKGLPTFALLSPGLWLLLLCLALIIMKTLFLWYNNMTWLCDVINLLILTFTFATVNALSSLLCVILPSSASSPSSSFSWGLSWFYSCDCIENFPNQMRYLHFCQFYVELHATFLRSFNFNCFRTLI